MSQVIATLDLEGVLFPEVWVAVAETVNVPELCLTTRDEPDYGRLMRHRLRVLRERGISLSDILQVIWRLRPLPGALSFLNELRRSVPVLLLSDTFEEFAAPILHHLSWPTLLCHRLVTEGEMILDYRLRTVDHKRRTVESLQQLEYRVVAVGDSYNDIGMLTAADTGFLFRPPPSVRSELPRLGVITCHEELSKAVAEAISVHQQGLASNRGQ